MSDRKEYKFQFMPLEGRLPGLMMERQLEDVINDLGLWIVDISDESEETSQLAKDAYEMAVKAQASADNAQVTADQASETAKDAQSMAESARDTANSASETANSASETANSASETANTATETANNATDTANTAKETADNAAEAANQAQQTATDAVETANQALLAAEDGKAYICIGFPDEDETGDESGNEETVDLNDYYEFGRWHTAAGVANNPTDDAEYFVDVDIDDAGSVARQTAVMLDSGDTYTRWGEIEETVPDDDSDDEGEITVTWGDWIAGGGSSSGGDVSDVTYADGVLTVEKSDGSSNDYTIESGAVYSYRGSIESYEDLPENPSIGDVYNIETADPEHGIKAGDNVAWTGENWDNLSGIFDTSEMESEIAEIKETADQASKDAADAKESASDAVSDVTYSGNTLTVKKGNRSTSYTISGDYLPLSGGTLTGDLNVGGITLRASDGHIVLPNGIEIY